MRCKKICEGCDWYYTLKKEAIKDSYWTWQKEFGMTFFFGIQSINCMDEWCNFILEHSLIEWSKS